MLWSDRRRPSSSLVNWTRVASVWNKRRVPPPLDSSLVKALLAGRAGDVDAAAVEAAVNQQLIHGGALDTLLLEAQALSEARLAAVLCEVWQTAPVTPQALRAPAAAAVARLPRRMAVAMGLVPLEIDADARLHVACRSPLDQGLVAEVSELLQQDVVAHVVPEVRLRQGMQAAYGHDLDERFVSLLRAIDPESASTVSASSPGAAPTGTPTASNEAVVSWDLVEALAHLAAQDSRDGIGRVAVAYARKFLPFAAIFGVRDGACIGWQREGPAKGLAFTRPFPLPDDCFVTPALASSSPVLLRPDASDGSAAFFGWLGRRRPQTALVVPIVVARRAVGALYADGGFRHRDPREVGELVAFAARLGAAFESLLRQRHRAHPSIFPQPSPPTPPTTPPEAVSPPPPEVSSSPPPPEVSSPPASPPDASSPSPSPEAPPPEAPAAHEAVAPSPSSSTVDEPAPTEDALPEPPPAPPAPAAATTDGMPSMPAMPSVRRDGTSPFARGYSKPAAPPSTPSLPPSAAAPAPPDESAYVADALGDIVITGVGPPLNEHLPTLAATDAAPEAPAQPFFPLPEEKASEAWRGALHATVEQGLQGGSVDDDDLDWEAVVYDPAHAAELEGGPTAPAPKPKEALDFPTLSTSTLADLIDDLDAPPPVPADAALADGPATDALSAPGAAPTGAASVEAALEASSSKVSAPLASQTHKELVELLFAGDDDVVARAGRELVSRGRAAVPALGERFPGRLRIDPFDPGDNVRSADRLGPLVDVLARLGHDGLDAAIPHVDSRYPAHRFAAVLLFAHTPDARAIDLLRNRLHDAEPRIQKLAAEALVPFLAHPRFETLLVHLRERTSATAKPYPLEARRRAAELLGEFRDVGAVPLLVNMLAFPEMQEVARHALRATTLQDLGARPKPWEKWWQRAKKRSRIDWLIDGLQSEELSLRQLAHRELAALTGDDFGYRADCDKRARARAVEVWLQWWVAEQKQTSHPKAAASL